MTLRGIFVATLFGGLLAPAAFAQEEHHHHGEAEGLGTVHFPVSCKPDVQAAFARGVALLHSFGYEEARNAFAGVAPRPTSTTRPASTPSRRARGAAGAGASGRPASRSRPRG